MNTKRAVDYDRAAFLAEHAKYIRELRRAGYEWNAALATSGTRCSNT
jgi:hypothetical protein